MNRAQLDAVSARAEELAQRAPRRYRLLLVAMAAAGYAYILLVLLALIALLIVLGLALGHSYVRGALIKPIILLLLLIFLILRAMWVRVSPPGGLPLRREDAPKLFDLIEEVRTQARVRRVDAVLLQYDLNAAVAQVPRLGLFGWHKHYLTLGLPLMQALAPDQFRAVLAHEFGHLSGAHGKFGVWIYRVHQTWQRLVSTFASQRQAMAYVFVPFYKFLIPRFVAWSMVQVRQHEFQADRDAAQFAGRDAAISALTRIHLASELLAEQFWPRLYRRACSEAQPPAPFGAVCECLRQFQDAGTAEAWIRRSLNTNKEGYDTHPTLAARISALRGSAAPVPPSEAAALACTALLPTPSAAEFYLGDHLPRLTAALDRAWQTFISPAWRGRHQESQQQRQALAALNARGCTGALTPDETWTRAWLTEEVEDETAALPLYQAILAGNPAHAKAMFAVGRILLARRDAAGVPLVQAVMRTAPEGLTAGRQLLAKYFYDVGNVEEARQWRIKAEDAYVDVAQLEQEKANLTERDTLLPHDVAEGSVTRIREELTALRFDGCAYLVRKQLKRHPNATCYVLALVRRVAWWRYEDSGAVATRNKALANELIQKLAVLDLDYRLFFLGRAPLAKRIRHIPNAEIYRA